MSQKQTISIVIPLYNEAPNLRPLYDELAKTVAELPTYDFEFIFVDDGSEDDSAKLLYKLRAADPRIVVVQFARNFGKEPAVSAGLHRAQGVAAIVIDADMQMPPSLIGEFIARWEKGAEIVVGVFAARNMQFTRRVGAKFFYRIMQVIANTKITPHATDYRLLDRQVIDTFNELPERNRITRGLIDWMGFERDYIHFEQNPRLHGTPNYSFKKLVALAINTFTSYSLVPLKMAGYLGIVILTLSIPATVFLYVLRFVLHNPMHWTINSTTFLAMLILFLIGLVLVCLGLMSLYIAHIQTEVIGRPLYIVRQGPRAQDVQDETDESEELQEPMAA